MDFATRTQLTQELSALSQRIAAELLVRFAEPGAVRERARALHGEEKVGEDFDVWADLLSRRAAVSWVLKTVYVRVLEDRGFLSPRRIVDADGPRLFERLAPNLGETAYLRWIFRDLAQADGGLPELFSPQPAELCAPSDTASRELLAFWRRRDPDSGELVYTFADEHFDGRLMGDLYQDLDPVVKARFALLQTPDFIVDFILDETLDPAIETFGIDEVRVLDPACGSGHFLLAAFKRLVDGMREAHPERPVAEVVRDVLARVVGIDLNDYAGGLARARLLMTALELLGERDLAAGANLHPQIYWADALEQLELDELTLTGLRDEDQPRATLTQPEVRRALAPLLQQGFHAVVGNPPYITEKDAEKKRYHREKVGSGKSKRPRYLSAYRKYSLGAPFTERMFQQCVEGGYVGQITANSFMKREFGKALISEVLARQDVTKVVDTSGAYVPGHGTPTVLLFGRRRRPSGDTVPVVMGKRGEPGKPEDPARGLVWSSIAEGHATIGYESEYVSVAAVPRATLDEHPWSLGGGGAAELKAKLEKGAANQLAERMTDVGRTTHTGEDNAYFLPTGAAQRLGIEGHHLVWLVKGENLRDWASSPDEACIFPYDLETADPSPPTGRELWHFWRYRTLLKERRDFGEKIEDRVVGGRKLNWFEHTMFFPDRYRTPLSIAFAFKATHNHFVLDRGGKVFNRTAPVIKLPPEASEDDHLALLGQLNSSTACFWLKQVLQCMGAQGVNEGMKSEEWMQFYEHDGSKLQRFPLPTDQRETVALASTIHTIAQRRSEDDVAALLGKAMRVPDVTAALEARRARDTERLMRMVALQEELDWLCYRLYGIDTPATTGAPADELRDPDTLPPLRPGQRPFELTLAQQDRTRRAAVERGEEPDERPTAWFERHGWDPVASLDDVPEAHRAVVEARLARTARSPELSLLEQPTYKRRWYKPDYDAEEAAAFALFLADEVEEVAKTRREPFTVRHIAAALQGDVAFEAVAELAHGKGFDLDDVVRAILDAESVPNLKHHVYKPKGLTKRAAWEKCWATQHAEDAWDTQQRARREALDAGQDPQAAPPAPEGPRPVPEVPPKYGSGDFLETRFWRHRGKLDVPKERFIAFTEAPAALTADGTNPLYGWAGWTPYERAQALMALDELAEQAEVPVAERHGLLAGLAFLVPYVRWGLPRPDGTLDLAAARTAATEIEAILRDLLGREGMTEAQLAAWAKAHPPPKTRAPRKKRAKNHD